MVLLQAGRSKANRLLLFIAYPDERWSYYKFSLSHLCISLYKVRRMYFLNLGVKGLSERDLNSSICVPLFNFGRARLLLYRYYHLFQDTIARKGALMPTSMLPWKSYFFASFEYYFFYEIHMHQQSSWLVCQLHGERFLWHWVEAEYFTLINLWTATVNKKIPWASNIHHSRHRRHHSSSSPSLSSFDIVVIVIIAITPERAVEASSLSQ